MAALEGGAGDDSGDMMAGWKEKVESEWRRIKEHAETYPYVWGSYILVYGGLGTFLAYRWRKLRRTEDRVRALQERLRELVEVEASQAGGSTGTTSKPVPRPPETTDASGEADRAFKGLTDSGRSD